MVQNKNMFATCDHTKTEVEIIPGITSNSWYHFSYFLQQNIIIQTETQTEVVTSYSYVIDYMQSRLQNNFHNSIKDSGLKVKLLHFQTYWNCSRTILIENHYRRNLRRKSLWISQRSFAGSKATSCP